MFDVDVDFSCSLVDISFWSLLCTNVAFALFCSKGAAHWVAVCCIDDCICWECSISIGEWFCKTPIERFVTCALIENTEHWSHCKKCLMFWISISLFMNSERYPIVFQFVTVTLISQTHIGTHIKLFWARGTLSILFDSLVVERRYVHDGYWLSIYT